MNPIYKTPPKWYNEPSLAVVQGYRGEDYFVAPYSQEYYICAYNPNSRRYNTVSCNVALVRVDVCMLSCNK